MDESSNTMRSKPGLCAIRTSVSIARFACDPPLCAGQAAAGVLPGDAGAVGEGGGVGVVAAAVGCVGADWAGVAVAVGRAVVGAAVEGAGVTRTVSGKHAAAEKVSATSAARSLF